MTHLFNCKHHQLIPTFAAGVLLALAFYVGRLVSQLLAGVLAGAGFDSVLQKLGLSKDMAAVDGAKRPSHG